MAVKLPTVNIYIAISYSCSSTVCSTQWLATSTHSRGASHRSCTRSGKPNPYSVQLLGRQMSKCSGENQTCLWHGSICSILLKSGPFLSKVLPPFLHCLLLGVFIHILHLPNQDTTLFFYWTSASNAKETQLTVVLPGSPLALWWPHQDVIWKIQQKQTYFMTSIRH